jgi:hypothetical protein
MSGDRTVAKLFGAMLMAVGVLIAGLAGLCSASFIVMMIAQPGGGAMSGVPMVLVFGGVPIAIGVGIFVGGRELWRGPPPVRRVDPKRFD